jgi:hypothetical protein
MWDFLNTYMSYRRGKDAGLSGLAAIIVFILFCYSFDDMLPIYLWLQLDDVMRFFNLLQNDGFHIEILLFGFLKLALSIFLIGSAIFILFIILTVAYTMFWNVLEKLPDRKKKIKKPKVKYIHPIGRNKMAIEVKKVKKRFKFCGF